MTDIFLSYSWQDKDRARAIRDALRSAGYSVWWDEDLNPEEKVTQEILDAHDASTRVLVLWSFASVESDWVTGEAERAKRHKKLIQAFLDDLDLLEYHPQFNNFHGLDLVNWEDGKDETEWPRLLRHLGRVIGPGRLAPGAPEPAEPAHHPDPDDGPVLFPMSSRILLPLLGLAAVMVPLLWQVTLDWGWLLPIAVILAPCLIVLVWTFFSYRPPLQRGDRGGDRAGNRRLRNIVSGQAGWERRYIRWLNDGLHGFSRWIGEPQVTGTPDEALPRAWTGTSLFFCLGLAIAYPLLFLLIGWALGGSGALGGFELLSADTPCVRRAGVFGFIFTVAVSVWIERRLAARGREVVGYILLVLGLCVSLVPLSYAIVNSGVVVGVGFGVGFGAVIGVGVGVGAVVGVGVGAVVGVGVGAVVGVGVDAVVGVGVDAVVGLGFGAVIGVGVGVVVNRRGWGSGPALLSVIGLPALVAGFLTLDGASDRVDIEPDGMAIILFVMLIPSLNALLDWLSLGVTRMLLNRIADGRHRGIAAAGWAAADVALALMFLVLVGAMTVSGLAAAEHLHRLGGVDEAIFSTMTFINQVEAAPFWEHGWLWAILLTTLLPTLLHFSLALRAAMISAIPLGTRDWLVERIRRAPGDDRARGQAQLVLSAFPALAILLALSTAVSAAWIFTIAYTDWRDDLFTGARWLITAIQTNWNGWPFTLLLPAPP